MLGVSLTSAAGLVATGSVLGRGLLLAGLLSGVGYLLGRWRTTLRLRVAEREVDDSERAVAYLAEQQWWLQRELQARELEVEDLQRTVQQQRPGQRSGWFDVDGD